MTEPIDRMIDESVTCSKCGAKGFMNCDCWEKCSCDYIAERGKPCTNPETARCTTKVMYGRYSRKTRRYE